MNAMRAILDEFLQNSTPEQLRAELAKGNRPFFQTLKDCEFVCEYETVFPTTMPASVSFFSGKFAPEDHADLVWRGTMAAAANEECALAA